MSVRYRRRQAVPTNRMGHFEGSNVPLLFSALDVDSGIFNLTSDLTLNGQTVAPTFRYEGLSASVASWPAIVGNTLPTFSAGTDPTIGDLTPFTKAGELSVLFQAGKGYQYTDNTYADITDDNADVVFETVFQYNPKAGENTIFSKYNTATNKGYLLLVDSSDRLRAYALGASNITTLTKNAWYHVMGIIDRNGRFRWYLNGSSAVDFATVAGTQSVAKPLEVASYNGGASKGLNSIAYMAMYIGPAGWVGSSADQDAVVKERFARLTGVYASVGAAGTRVPTSMTRASAGSLDRDIGSGVRQVFLVGANWPRLCVRGSTKGFLSEVASTNRVLRSTDLTHAAWTINAITVTTGVSSPDGRSTAFGLKPAVANAGHYVQAAAIAGSVDYASVWAKKGSNDWLAMTVNGGTGKQWFNLASGTLGTSGGASLNPFIEDWGDGWYLCGCGPEGGTNRLLLYTTNADGANSYNETSGANVGTYLWGPMMATGTVYGAVQSYIPTYAATVSRQIDNLAYDIAGNYLSVKGTIQLDTRVSQYVPLGRDMRLVTAAKDANNTNQFGVSTTSIQKALFTMTTGGVAQVSGNSTSSICTSANVNVKARWATNFFQGLVANAVEVTDAALTPPTQATGSIYVGQSRTNAVQPVALVANLRIYAGIK